MNAQNLQKVTITEALRALEDGLEAGYIFDCRTLPRQTKGVYADAFRLLVKAAVRSQDGKELFRIRDYGLRIHVTD